MKTLEIDIDNINAAAAIGRLLKEKNIQTGDKIDLKLNKKESSLALIGLLVLVAIALSAHFQRRKEERMLQDVFKGFDTPDELEAHIEKEYGVDLELKTYDFYVGEEQKDWNDLSVRNFSKLYNEEKGIEDIKVKEPNPKFNLDEGR